MLGRKETYFVKLTLNATGLPLRDLVFGTSVYLPPFFKAFTFGFVIWLVVHRPLHGWIYAGDIWHPLLMDSSLFAIYACLALAILAAWQLCQLEQLSISQQSLQ